MMAGASDEGYTKKRRRFLVDGAVVPNEENTLLLLPTNLRINRIATQCVAVPWLVDDWCHGQ
jgi:hypothetical protein